MFVTLCGRTVVVDENTWMPVTGLSAKRAAIYYIILEST